jgi:hypothetical protein
MYAKTGLMLLSALATVTLVAHAATVEKQSFSGTQASTFFSIDQQVTCADGSEGSVFAFGALFGSEQITKETGSPRSVSNGINVEIDSYSNSCTGTNFSGFGGAANAFAAPNKRLTSAGLTGTVSVQDFGSGATVLVGVDVVIVGTGPISTSKSSTKTKTVQCPGGPVTITITRSANSNRAGDASGSLTIEGFELDPAFNTTTLLDNSNSTISIEKKR